MPIDWNLKMVDGHGEWKPLYRVAIFLVSAHPRPPRDTPLDSDATNSKDRKRVRTSSARSGVHNFDLHLMWHAAMNHVPDSVLESSFEVPLVENDRNEFVAGCQV